MPELLEVETIRRDLERRSSASGSRRSRPPAPLDPAPPQQEELHHPPRGRQDHRCRPQGQVPDPQARQRRRARRPLGHERPVLRAAPKDPAAKHTHVVITFTQGGQLRFVDLRTFGEMFVTTPDQPEQEIPTGRPRVRPCRRADVVDVVRRGARQPKGKLKAVLMDQKFIAGLGNIYSDEILFAAGLHTTVRRRRYDSRRSAAVPGAGRDAARGHQATRLVTGRRAVPRLFGEVGEFQLQQGPTPARARRAGAAERRSCGPNSRAAAPSSASNVRCSNPLGGDGGCLTLHQGSCS